MDFRAARNARGSRRARRRVQDSARSEFQFQRSAQGNEGGGDSWVRFDTGGRRRDGASRQAGNRQRYQWPQADRSRTAQGARALRLSAAATPGPGGPLAQQGGRTRTSSDAAAERIAAKDVFNYRELGTICRTVRL